MRFVFFGDDTVSLYTGFPTFQDKLVVLSSRSQCPRIPSDAGSNPRRTCNVHTTAKTYRLEKNLNHRKLNTEITDLRTAWLNVKWKKTLN
jgi:hypothetical protein